MLGSGVVVLLSGGMDSSTLVAMALSQFDRVATLSVDYGQRHSRELTSARRIADWYAVTNRVIPLRWFGELVNTSCLTGNMPVPHGHYQDDNMRITVVPGRNTVLLTVAASWAVSLGFTHVAFGAHAGDHAIYPDCRPEYVQAMSALLGLFHYKRIELWAPLLGLTKGDICKIGLQLKVPYQLTWTCYEGGTVPCGMCGSCRERAEAFEVAGVSDPLLV